MIVHEIYAIPMYVFAYTGVFGGTGIEITLPKYEDRESISAS